MPLARTSDPARVQAGGDLVVFERSGRVTAVRLPRHGVAISLAFVVVLVTWSAACAYYMAFHDAVVAEIRHGARTAAAGYELQIADLRSELERARTRRLVEQTGAAERLKELARRQETLERRHVALAELAAGDKTAGVPTNGAERALSYGPKPTPLHRPTSAFDDLAAPDLPSGARPAAEKLSSALDRIEARQAETLTAIAVRTDDRRAKLRTIYRSLGLGPKMLDDDRARGGPFEPLRAHVSAFDARMAAVAADSKTVATLRRGLDAAPIRSPAPPGAALSSGFGTRLDPFLRQPAFHAGLDFESEQGQPIRATAAGVVTNASFSGGYGLMVEVDHGRGLTTRFGHMSAVAVQPGQQVKAGQLLGRVGSTGRSTGPHLHYETRVDGEALDPIRFLRAGQALAAID